MALNFDNCKKERLSSVDLSRKGSIDEAILELTGVINSSKNYFTTSSCSGRIIIVQNDEKGPKKKGCQWRYTSHEKSSHKEVMEALVQPEGDMVFKFEPFIMHIQCRNIEDAQYMHAAAVASGLRNSGITIGFKGKIMVAIRSSHGLEVPLSHQGVLMVSEQYITFLIEVANRKMEENVVRINRFLDEVNDLERKQTMKSENLKTKLKKKEQKEIPERDTKKNESVQTEDAFNSCIDLFSEDNG